MWTLPGPKLARLYNILTVLLAVPCCYILMRVMLSDLNASSDSNSVNLVVGASWLVIPLLALAGVAVATFPSVSDRIQRFISALSFGSVTLLAAVPLFLIFVV